MKNVTELRLARTVAAEVVLAAGAFAYSLHAFGGDADAFEPLQRLEALSGCGDMVVRREMLDPASDSARDYQRQIALTVEAPSARQLGKAAEKVGQTLVGSQFTGEYVYYEGSVGSLPGRQLNVSDISEMDETAHSLRITVDQSPIGLRKIQIYSEVQVIQSDVAGQDVAMTGRTGCGVVSFELLPDGSVQGLELDPEFQTADFEITNMYPVQSDGD